MFQQSYRGTLVWLLIVGAALALTLAAGAISTGVGALLIALYLLLSLVVLRGSSIDSLRDALPKREATPAVPSEVAREATARARNLPDFDSLIRLLDVGLIVDEHRPDGLSLRRGRFISLDDDGIRPFMIVHVPAGLGDRLARVRFEIRDDTGKVHYAYEDDAYLQTGENTLVPDYRFPIRKRADGIAPGAWSLRVMVDDGILGVHNFNMSPSLEARRRLMGSDGELRDRVWQSHGEDESLPLSLEELLRQQSRMQSRQGKGG